MTWVVGVDTSVYQPGIDWEAVAGAGVGFALHRTGDGRLTDETFAENIAAARAAGLVALSGYHFNRMSETPETQVEHIWDFVGAAGGATLPIAMDIEAGSERNAMCNPLTWVRRARDKAHELQGVDPIFYTNPGWWDAQIAASPGSSWCWPSQYHFGYRPFDGPLDKWAARALAPYGGPDVPHGWARWDLWQFTSSADIPGMPGLVDASICDSSTLARLGVPQISEPKRWLTMTEIQEILDAVATLRGEMTRISDNIGTLDAKLDLVSGYRLDLHQRPDGRMIGVSPGLAPTFGNIIFAAGIPALLAHVIEAATAVRPGPQWPTPIDGVLVEERVAMLIARALAAEGIRPPAPGPTPGPGPVA